MNPATAPIDATTSPAMSTTSTLPTAWTLLDNALQARRPVWVSYHQRRRLICPHALGWNNNRPMLLSYQTGGETSTGTLHADPRKRWRCMFIDEIDHVDLADPANPWGTADNYNHSHPFSATHQLATAITP